MGNAARRQRTLASARRLGALAAGTAIAFVVVACAPATDAGAPTPTSTPTRTATPTPTPTPSSTIEKVEGLAWADEFDAPLSEGKWQFAVGAHGWGNEELQSYTDRTANAYVEDGILHLTAIRESDVDEDGNTADYTSARIYSSDAFLYGRMEARMRVPIGPGLWSAFWLYGVETSDELDWPAGGEIDVVELLGNTLDLHSGVYGIRTDDEPWTKSIESLYTGEPWGGAWHVYGVEWQPDYVAFTLDGEERGRVTRAEMGSEEIWSTVHPANIVLNLAVSSNWGGAPDETTPFPSSVEVDWVRVYDTEVHRGLHSDGY